MKFLVTILVILIIMAGNKLTNDNEKREKEKKNNTTTTYKVEKPKQQTYQYKPTQTTTKKEDNKDPLSLSMKSAFYYVDPQLRKYLSHTNLEYPSKVEYIEKYHYRYSWVLKSNNKEVYACDYSYSNQRKNKEKSIVACEVKEAYQQWKDGDRKLYRDYYMPIVDKEIDMIVSEYDTFCDKYFALGKYSDMKCYVKGNNIYCTFYWYQRTNNGPVLVYMSSCTNKTTTWGQRYNNWVWNLYDETMGNIDIIPYDEYPRSYDYYELYEKWEKDDRNRRIEEELKSEIETYCVFDDAEDLFYEYPDDFEYFEDAEDFYDNYCQ